MENNFKYTIILIDGKLVKTNRYDYYNNGGVIGCRDEQGRHWMCGTRFVKDIQVN